MASAASSTLQAASMQPRPMPAGHRVGPNAIIQTREALDAICGSEMRRTLFAAAGLGRWQEHDPDHLVDAGDVQALSAAIARALPSRKAERVLSMAGGLTGGYILANRIPPFAQRLLRALPARCALPVLLMAVKRHSWTFAGAAPVTCGADWRGRGWIIIEDNPLCAGRAGFERCIWHEAVFKRLFSELVSPGVTVQETACTGGGQPSCRFDIRLSAR
jgi:divinyl protochlorophyllide a 8-vinyl-reductase